MPSFLQTQEGKLKLANAIAAAVRKHLVSDSFARNILHTDIIPDGGAIPVYNASTYTYYYGVQNTRIQQSEAGVRSVRNARVALEIFEVGNMYRCPFSRLRQMANTAQDQETTMARECVAQFSQTICAEESRICTELLQTASSTYQTTDTKKLDMDFLRDLFASQVPFEPKKILMDFRSAAHLKMSVDKLSLNDSLSHDIIVSQHCPENTIFVLAEPEQVGIIPIRTDLQVLCADDPSTASIGFSSFQQIGMGILHPENIFRVQIEQPKPEPKIKSKYHYISKMS